MSRLLLILLVAVVALAVGCGEPTGSEPVPQPALQVLPTPIGTQVSTAPEPQVPLTPIAQIQSGTVQTPPPASARNPTPTPQPLISTATESTPIPTPTPVPIPTVEPLPAEYSIDAVAYTIVEVERGLGTVQFTIGVKNTGAGQGTGPVPISVTSGDAVTVIESDFGRPDPGLGGFTLVTVSLPLTSQQVQIETPHSLHQLEVDLRPITIELTGHEIVGDGLAWLAMRASNRLPVRIEPTIVTAAWAPDADGDGSDHCEPPPEDPEFDTSILSLSPGEIQNLGVFSPVAVGSHTVYLCVYPLVENSRQELVWVATQLDV